MRWSLAKSATLGVVLPVLFILWLVFSTIATAFGAGIPAGSGDLGGWFYPLGSNAMPSFGSSSSDNGTQVYGSFWLNLDANTTSLSYANWSFYTNPSDTSYWTATCYLHGLRDSYTACPQSKNWSQSYSGANGVNLYANTNLNCYELSENGKQVLGLNGSFNILPSVLQSSNFNYSDTTDNSYSWPNGYDHDPVITQVPNWNAQFSMYGQFIAPTIEEARAMGLMFAQSVPEPSAIILLAVGAITIVGWRLRRPK